MQTELRIKTKNLHKSFDENHILKGIDIELYNGEFVSLMGPSGSGKSTLLNILGALIPSSKGEILLDGQSIVQMNKKELTMLRRNEIGWVFQDFNLIQNLTALENVLIPLHLAGNLGKNAEMRAMALLEKVDMLDRMEHVMDALSGGQQQRVAIARALANNPPIILADEPTGNLDSESGKLIVELFKELAAEGKVVLMVTHDVELAHAAQKVYILRDGILEVELQGMEVEI
ncbi:MAG: ABC transporter ATP-binding protein [Candidatus Heimdallarchaeota archaeon]|nr:ABC transporter ATP-binding protein [Candidatus Heimdallarchaeota archaeon]